MYYTQEEDLARDAKKCELEFAKMHILLEKVKLAFVKDRLSIARMVIIIAGIATLLLPFANAAAELPYHPIRITLSGLGVYQMISDGLLTQLMNLLNAGVASDLTVLLFADMGIFVAMFFALLGVFVTWLLGFLNLRKSCRVMNGFCIAAGCLCAAGILVSLFLQISTADYSLFSAKLGLGYIVMLALLCGLIAVNVKLYRKNPQPQIKSIDLERIEILGKVKKGEISLDDLPLPVIYSEEEELARTQFIGADNKKEKKKKNKKKGGDENG